MYTNFTTSYLGTPFPVAGWLAVDGLVVNFQGGLPKPVKCNLRKRMARVLTMNQGTSQSPHLSFANQPRRLKAIYPTDGNALSFLRQLQRRVHFNSTHATEEKDKIGSITRVSMVFFEVTSPSSSNQLPTKLERKDRSTSKRRSSFPI